MAAVRTRPYSPARARHKPGPPTSPFASSSTTGPPPFIFPQFPATLHHVLHESNEFRNSPNHHGFTNLQHSAFPRTLYTNLNTTQNPLLLTYWLGKPVRELVYPVSTYCQLGDASNLTWFGLHWTAAFAPRRQHYSVGPRLGPRLLATTRSDAIIKRKVWNLLNGVQTEQERLQ